MSVAVDRDDVFTRAVSAFVTVKQGAEYLGVTERTMRSYIDAGRIQKYRLGPSMIRLKLSDLEALIEPVTGRR